VLARHCEVTLAAPPPSELEDDRIALLHATQEDFDVLHGALRTHDVVVAQQLPAQLLRYVTKLPVRYVADLYNPKMIELLEAMADAGVPREQSVARQLTRMVFAQCAAADFLLCASEKQRDLWIGGLGLSGLIDLETYRRDRTYRAVIDVVPFGLSDRPAVHARQVLKGVWPGIGPDDHVLLWGGGIWHWLDPLTPIKAVERLVAEGRRDVHLFFLGVQRPAAEGQVVPSGAEAAMTYARDRRLDGTCVHFNRGWVPYEERQSYLLEADLGISAHHDHLETRYSFRTRGPRLPVGGPAHGPHPRGLDGRPRRARGPGRHRRRRGRRGLRARLRRAPRRSPPPRGDRRPRARSGGGVPLGAGSAASRGLLHRPGRAPGAAPPRHDRALATYGQYPGILANALRTQGALGAARRVSRQVGRVLRHGA
jgi:hypothetical protein